MSNQEQEFWDENENIDESFHDDDSDLFEPENDDYPIDYYEGW